MSQTHDILGPKTGILDSGTDLDPVSGEYLSLLPLDVQIFSISKYLSLNEIYLLEQEDHRFFPLLFQETKNKINDRESLAIAAEYFDIPMIKYLLNRTGESAENLLQLAYEVDSLELLTLILERFDFHISKPTLSHRQFENFHIITEAEESYGGGSNASFGKVLLTNDDIYRNFSSEGWFEKGWVQSIIFQGLFPDLGAILVLMKKFRHDGFFSFRNRSIIILKNLFGFLSRSMLYLANAPHEFIDYLSSDSPDQDIVGWVGEGLETHIDKDARKLRRLEKDIPLMRQNLSFIKDVLALL